jgi:hypothetical protein
VVDVSREGSGRRKTRGAARPIYFEGKGHPNGCCDALLLTTESLGTWFAKSVEPENCVLPGPTRSRGVVEMPISVAKAQSKSLEDAKKVLRDPTRITS